MRWNSAEVKLNSVVVYDVLATIVDKDGVEHTKIFKGDYTYGLWDTDFAYTINTRSQADKYFERNEYVTTDAGLKIPRCNIKHIKYSIISETEVTPSHTVLGLRDWPWYDWLGWGLVATPFVMVLILLIYKVSTFLKS